MGYGEEKEKGIGKKRNEFAEMEEVVLFSATEVLSDSCIDIILIWIIYIIYLDSGDTRQHH